MAQGYSTDKGRANSSEVMRKVKAGLMKSLIRLEDEGVVSRGRKPRSELWPLAKKRAALAILGVLALAITPALAADTSKASDAAKEVRSGAKKIGESVKETAKGIGRTVAKGAKETSERFKEAGQAAKSPAKSAWQSVKEAASSFGRSVKSFFNRLFGKA